MIYGRPEEPFFEHNSDMRYVTEVAALIDSYGLEKAGIYMWAIWLVHHPGSGIFELDPVDKVEWIKANYLKDTGFEWPEKKVVLVKPDKKPKPAKPARKKKGLDDDFDDEEIEADNFDLEIDLNGKKFRGVRDKDLLFEETGVHQSFYDVIEIFPIIAMGLEERSYYGLVRLRDIAMLRAEYLNGKDLAAAIRQIAGANADLDKMKEKYLTWKETSGGDKAGGDVQSGWASRQQRRT